MEAVASCPSLKIYLRSVILFMKAVINCPSLKIYLRWQSHIAHLSKFINRGRPLRKTISIFGGPPLETGPIPTSRPNTGDLPQCVRARTDSDVRAGTGSDVCALRSASSAWAQQVADVGILSFGPRFLESGSPVYLQSKARLTSGVWF